jgi:membrane protein
MPTARPMSLRWKNSFSPAVVKVPASSKAMSLETPGHTLIEEGDDSRTAYFLYAGRALVYKDTGDSRRRLGELNEGQLFGEMAYLLNEKRTASVVADTDITVLALPPQIMEELMRHSAPLSRRIIDTLCQRLERMNLANPG